ncbi:MAG: DegT/DnrJ/EryC1/StrS family aminotransferase [Candidatus Binatia bacterium]
MSTEILPFHVPEIAEDEIQLVVDTLRSGWLTTGPKTKELEELFAQYIGCRHAVAVNSCTAALHLALDAVGIREGDEVLVPTMTFAATAEVVLYFRARPVFVDCQADTCNLDPNQLERLITSKTRAVIPVHFAGHPCDMTPILQIAKKYNLRVIEDAAHALPASYLGQTVGTIGDLTCFSFYATKTITTGEGGMITTDNEEFADRVRMMSLHGISKTAWNRYTTEGSWYYEILTPGYKYNLTDIAAALGIGQLRKCQRFWEVRQRIAQCYSEGLADVPEVQIPACHSTVQHAWHLYVIQLRLERLRITRNAFIEELKNEGIATSVHFIPLHLHPYYQNTLHCDPCDFPQASGVYQRTISLPIYPKMSGMHVEKVVAAVRKIVERSRR